MAPEPTRYRRGDVVLPRRAPAELVTPRLLLRPWRASDREPFAAMHADPEVVRHVGSGVLSAVASDALRARVRREWARSGYGSWALERRADGAFLGFCGLTRSAWRTGAVPGELEIGWRLARQGWGHGYATEAAVAGLEVAWSHLRAPAVVALVHPANERSLGVGERLGMRVVRRTRHLATGWGVLVLRADPPESVRAPASAPPITPATRPGGTEQG